MRLLKVEARNVFSIDHLELRLCDRGLTLISGENGSGKSSIANKSILWGLYGATSGGVSANDVIRRQAPKDEHSYVEIEFEGVDGGPYRIIRSRRPKATLELFSGEDDKDLTRRQQSETQDTINQLLGRDLQAFLQTDYMGQGREQSFLSLTPKAQKDILEQILPIKYLSSWATSAKQFRTELKAVLSKVNDRINKSSGKVEQAETYYGQMKDKAAWFEGNKRDQLAKYRSEIEEESGKAKPLLDMLELKKKELSQLDSEVSVGDVESLKVVIEEYEKRLDKHSAELNDASKSSLDWHSHHAVLSSKIVDTTGVCPTCGQSLSTEALEKYQKEQETYKSQLEQAKDAVAQIKLYTDNISAQKDTDSKVVAENKQKLKMEEAKLEKYRALEREISDITSRTQTSRLPTLREAMATLSAQRNPFSDAVVSSGKEVDELTKDLEKLNNKYRKLSESMTMLNFWVDAFSNDFRFFMLDKACPFLESKVAHHVKELNSSHLHASFSTTKELKSGDTKAEFAVKVWSDEGGEGFDSLSGGEQQILSFAMGLALADLAETQVGGASSVMILDEPFIYLDAKNSESLVNYLIGSKRETTLLISNDDHLKSLIPNVIGVVKNESGCTSFSN